LGAAGSARASPTIQQFEFTGNTAFSDERLAESVADYRGKPATLRRLKAAAQRIVDVYQAAGYPNLRFREPTFNDGTAQIRLIEPELGAIRVRGLDRLNPGYVKSRLRHGLDAPISRQAFRAAVNRLERDPNIRIDSAKLTGGKTPERNSATLEVSDPAPFGLTLSGGNTNPPSIGEWGGDTTATYRNLFGIGDRFQFSYGLSEGSNRWSAGFSVPVNPSGGTLAFRYSRGATSVVQSPFDRLGVESETDRWRLGFRQPVVRSRQERFEWGIGLELVRSQTFLFEDVPFSFAVGPERGTSNATVLTFTQLYKRRGEQRGFTARSQFRIGLDVFNATSTGARDGQFVAWRGQFRWLQRLGDRGSPRLVARLGTQLTGDPLLPVEQLPIGGSQTVRGYAENRRLGDGALFGSAELRVPLVGQPGEGGTLWATPFLDAGRVWANNGRIAGTPTLASVGLGLAWEGEAVSAELGYGIPLTAAERDGGTLQESGLHFSLQWQPL